MIVEVKVNPTIIRSRQRRTLHLSIKHDMNAPYFGNVLVNMERLPCGFEFGAIY